MSVFDTHGGYFAPKDYTRINEGGSHNENPNGGVQLGIAPDGAPNLLEEGEPVYQDYVFSDNIKADGGILEKFNLPKSYDGQLYSVIADKIVDEAEERPMDPISRNGLNAMLSRLSEAQEEQKALKQQKELEEELSKLSPEELMQLEEALGQMEQAQQMQQPEAQEVVPEEISPEEVAPEQVVPEQVPVMSCGGKVRRFDLGGPADADWRTYIKKGAVDLTPYMTNYKGGMTEDQLGWVLAGASGNQGQYHFYKPYPQGKDWIGLAPEEIERRKRVNQEADSLFWKVQAEAENANIEAQYRARQEMWNGLKSKAKNALGKLRLFDEGGDVPPHQPTLLFNPETGTASIAAPYSAQTVIDEPAVVAANSPETQAMIDKIHQGTDAAARTIYDVASAGSYMTPIGPVISGADAAGHFLAGDTKGGLRGLGRTALLAAGPVMGKATEEGYKGAAEAEKAYEKAFEIPARRYLWDPTAIWRSKWFKDATGWQKVARGAGALTQNIGSGAAWYAASKGAGWVYERRKDADDRRRPVGTTDAFKDFKFAEGGHLFDGTESSKMNRDADRSYWSNMWKQYGLPGFGLNYTIPDTFSYISNGTLGSNSPEHFLHYSYGPVKYAETPSGGTTPTGAVAATAAAAAPAFVRNDGDWEHFNLKIDPRARGIMNRALQKESDSVLKPKPELVGSKPYGERIEPYDGFTAYPTFPRFAKAIGSGLLGLYNAATPADHYTASRAVPYAPYGNIHLEEQKYVPVDFNTILNTQLAQANSTARMLQDNQTPSTMAGLIALDNNTTRNIGTGLLQGIQANNQQRNAVIAANNAAEAQRAQFDYGVDRGRVAGLDMAQRQNLRNELLLQQLNNEAESAKYAAVSNQINTGLDSLAGIGQENFAMNQINSNTALNGYMLAPNGLGGYHLVPGPRVAAEGGLLKKYKK